MLLIAATLFSQNIVLEMTSTFLTKFTNKKTCFCATAAEKEKTYNSW